MVVVVLKPAWSRIEHHGTSTDLAGREQARSRSVDATALEQFNFRSIRAF